MIKTIHTDLKIRFKEKYSSLERSQLWTNCRNCINYIYKFSKHFSLLKKNVNSIYAAESNLKKYNNRGDQVLQVLRSLVLHTLHYIYDFLLNYSNITAIEYGDETGVVFKMLNASGLTTETVLTMIVIVWMFWKFPNILKFSN